MKDANLILSIFISIVNTTIAALISESADGEAWGVLTVVFTLSLLASYFVQWIPAWGNWRRLLTPEQRKGQNHVFLSCFVLLSVAASRQVIGPSLSGLMVSDSDVRVLIRGHRWITYDPLEFDPYSRLDPKPESMETELAWIAAAGFDGVITFGSRGTRSMIPELAKGLGLSVMMGVWDPTDQEEIRTAISMRKYVDAYCVGHNSLDNLYSYRDLVDAMNLIRFRTRRPVATTEKLGLYEYDPRLVQTGDWLFPDAHIEVRDSGSSDFLADVARDTRITIERATAIAAVARKNDKPVLLKMIAYPMGGVTNASIQQQQAYFIQVLETRRDVDPEMPQDVAISVHSAFDTPWKTQFPFYEWDRYTGLLDDVGNPRPAATEIVRRLP